MIYVRKIIPDPYNFFSEAVSELDRQTKVTDALGESLLNSLCFHPSFHQQSAVPTPNFCLISSELGMSFLLNFLLPSSSSLVLVSSLTILLRLDWAREN